MEADKRVERESAVRERFEAIISNLAADNAALKRELQKEKDKFSPKEVLQRRRRMDK